MPRRVRTLADLGESALIERIARRARHPPDRRWVLGIGDDAAILRTRAGEELVFSTDAQVEGVHFLFGRETARVIGRRAMVVNLSDLAAMGAAPVGALLGFCAPRSMSLTCFDAIVGGFVDEARRFGCPLVGGNLSRAEQCNLSVTVIGRCRSGGALRRGGLHAGDRLFVTGELGKAALARLRADQTKRPLTHVPTPRLEAGRALARSRATRACIDLSDGLGTDLRNLLDETGLGAEVDLERLPAPRGFRRSCAALGVDPIRVLTGAGEDYELLFALAPSARWATTAALEQRLGVRVSEIGSVLAEPGVRGLPPVSKGHHF